MCITRVNEIRVSIILKNVKLPILQCINNFIRFNIDDIIGL